MLLPNKVVGYKESILSKFPIVLSQLKNRAMTPNKLYTKVKNKLEDVREYIEVLDCLYALGKIHKKNSWKIIKE